MRPIDADRLKKSFEANAPIAFQDCVPGIHAVIDLAPTVEVIRCRDCKHWNRDDGTFKDFDGKEWHGCKELDAYTSASGDAPVTPSWFYCGWAEGEKE